MLGNTSKIKTGIRSEMDNRVNIREFNRYGNLISHDITKLTDNELLDFIESVNKYVSHATFESAFRVALEKRKEPVALAHE